MFKLSCTALAATIVLGGCASTTAVLHNEVDEVFRVSYAPSVVLACFTHRNRVRVIERPDGARVVAFRNGYGGVVKAFSIYPEGTGSRIESRHSSFNVPGYKRRRCVGIEPMRPGDTGGVS